ncbi:Diaminopimelate epimerase-like protein [Mytilinidion resinicola]|uniref:Diaminopimelate epimerase-like protein n=1 Tax=Mytilinidion resinicola TaxID=574789 RepID=A0A6A6YGJ3_9PEZI|nr:Diaminopimelate epimerase-like protein [Mytilinidion resinicola]KAF2807921.1 Diaminopimelate epimerase-like protein [Mytilinidion resinicola]
MAYEFVTVDVFTKTRYEGNPLAIIKVPKSATLTQKQKQSIAAEFNLSESTFLHERSGEAYEWTVDIFMTDKELPFAGHPTIGTAYHALSEIAESGAHTGDEIIKAVFNVKAGKIDLQYNIPDKTAKASIPHNVNIHQRTCSRESLGQFQPGLKTAEESGTTSLKESSPVVSIVKGMTFVLVELADEKALGAVSTTSSSIEFTDLDQNWNETFVGWYFYVQLGSSEGGVIKLRTRMIEGLLEDPATGSATSALAGYLSLKEGKAGTTLKYEMTQGVEMGRRSEIGIEVAMAESQGIDTISLIGSAVRVMEGRVIA